MLALRHLHNFYTLIAVNRTVTLAYRYRVKDKHCAALNSMAQSVNFVWNYCNETQMAALKWGKRWPSGYDLCTLTSGTSKELGISATTINFVCNEYARKRKQHRKRKLRWRGKRNLGWIPMRSKDLSLLNGFRYYGKKYDVWLSRPIPKDARVCDGSCFSQDSKGRWYLNVLFEIPANDSANTKAIGIDLGLKDFATLSNGEAIAHPREYRALEEKLGKAQRAGKKRLAAAIHQKIKNRRQDFLHKESARLVKEYGHIVIGDVNAKGLAQTSMAKSVLDSGWSTFRNMLRYKCDYAGGIYEEVSEQFTTRTCSDCGTISGPKGREGLAIRNWVCVACGSVHNRDHNAALNILSRSTHGTPVEGAAA